MKLTKIILIGFIIVMIALVIYTPSMLGSNWAIFTSLLAVSILAILFLEFEIESVNSRMIPLLGILISLIVISRQIFHGIYEFSPVFFLVILVGYIFGFLNGFITGALVILVSNFFLGQGPWTIFQMVALGLIGFLAAFVPKFKSKKINLILLVLYGILSAYLYGAITDVFFWSFFTSQQTLNTYLAIKIAGLLADTSRAVGNTLFMLILGPSILKILLRFRKRFYMEYVK